MVGRLLVVTVMIGVAAGGFHVMAPSHVPASTATSPNRVAATMGAGRIFLDANQQADSRATALTPIKSLLNVGSRLNFGDFVWRDQGVPKGEVWLRVDLKSQLVSVFRAGHEIGTSVMLYGATEKQTPTGVFPVLAKIKDHESSIYDARMPYTLRLTGDGVSIHGSDVRWGAATHGCIGVPVEFARLIFDQAEKGTKVLILADRSASPLLAHGASRSGA